MRYCSLIFSLSLSLFPPFLSSLTCWSEFLRNSWNASWKPSWKPTGLWLFMDNSRRAALSKSTTFQHEIDIKLENESNPRQKGSTHSFLFKKKIKIKIKNNSKEKKQLCSIVNSFPLWASSVLTLRSVVSVSLHWKMDSHFSLLSFVWLCVSVFLTMSSRCGFEYLWRRKNGYNSFTFNNNIRTLRSCVKWRHWQMTTKIDSSNNKRIFAVVAVYWSFSRIDYLHGCEGE